MFSETFWVNTNISKILLYWNYIKTTKQKLLERYVQMDGNIAAEYLYFIRDEQRCIPAFTERGSVLVLYS